MIINNRLKYIKTGYNKTHYCLTNKQGELHDQN